MNNYQTRKKCTTLLQGILWSNFKVHHISTETWNKIQVHHLEANTIRTHIYYRKSPNHLIYLRCSNNIKKAGMKGEGKEKSYLRQICLYCLYLRANSSKSGAILNEPHPPPLSLSTRRRVDSTNNVQINNDNQPIKKHEM